MSSVTMGFPKGGVHPPEEKELSLGAELVTVTPPKKVIVPVTQHLGRPSAVVVNRGDEVVVGQVLAEATGPVSAAVHSPVSGKVLKIADGAVIGADRVPVIEIMNNGEDTGLDAFVQKTVSWKDKSSFLDWIRDAGVVGLGGATFPTHIKLMPPKDATVHTLIINGCECEPYLTADDTLMQWKPAEVLAGCCIMAGVLGISRILIGIEDNKPRAIEAMTVAAREGTYASFFDGDVPSFDVQVHALKTRYPQGAEKQLIDALIHRKVGAGKLPFTAGVVVQNSGTAYAAFEAVAARKPLIDRVMTVTGKGVEKPGNFLVRIGTPISEVVNAAGGAKENLKAIIAGGPMMGKSVKTLELPVVKGTSGVLLLTGEEIEEYRERECIRCGRCVEACPVNLVPCDVAAFAEFRQWDRAGKAMECVECGCCQYVCPANRYLVLYNRLAKYHWRRLQK